MEEVFDKYTYANFSKSDKLAKNIKNNNHHVVLIGIIIVLFTLYLTSSTVASFFGQTVVDFETKTVTVAKTINVYERPNHIKAIKIEQNKNENVCYDLDIFTKKNIIDKYEFKTTSIASPINDIFLQRYSIKPAQQSQKNRKKVNETKFLTKIHNGHNNLLHKSIKLKTLKNSDSKKEEVSEKSSTAEPIIYLFALVFIYLLLKAASDINQHYKSNKGDKRLRRYSLQSYAKAHTHDRRSSKGILLKNLPKFKDTDI